MISNTLTAACEEQNLFYAPYIPLQTTYMPDLTTPNRNDYHGTSDNGLCITPHGIYILLDAKNDLSKIISIWLNSKGNIIKRKYTL